MSFLPIWGKNYCPTNYPPPSPQPRWTLQPTTAPTRPNPPPTPRLACCEMRQQGPFSEKLAAISAIMLIFACAPQQEASFSCAARCPRETATKQKLINQQRPQASSSTADNTGHIPSWQRLVSCDLCCVGMELGGSLLTELEPLGEVCWWKPRAVSLKRQQTVLDLDVVLWWLQWPDRVYFISTQTRGWQIHFYWLATVSPKIK